MCQIIAHKFEVLEGTPPRRYLLTLRVGDENEVFVENGLAKELIKWDSAWGRYHPTSNRTMTKAIAEFDRRFALQHPSRIDQANAEMAHPRNQAATSPHGRKQSGDRQLPAGDRT